MKCIKFYRPYGGHVARVADIVADAAVSGGQAIYAPKHWLRAARLKARLEDAPEHPSNNRKDLNHENF